MGIAAEITASAKSARTKTIPAAQARRSHAPAVGADIALHPFRADRARRALFGLRTHSPETGPFLLWLESTGSVAHDRTVHATRRLLPRCRSIALSGDVSWLRPDRC